MIPYSGKLASEKSSRFESHLQKFSPQNCGCATLVSSPGSLKRERLDPGEEARATPTYTIGFAFHGFFSVKRFLLPILRTFSPSIASCYTVLYTCIRCTYLVGTVTNIMLALMISQLP